MKRLLILLAAVVFAMAPVTAMAARDDGFWAETGILFYDPDDMAVVCASMALGQATGSSTAGLSAQQAAFVDQYQGIASALSIQYGIPWRR